MLRFALFFLYFISFSIEYQDYRDEKYKLWNYQSGYIFTGIKANQSMHALDRVLLSMRSYYEEGARRIRELDRERWMFEISPHYESGYIMGEIIERYKKVIENCRLARIGENNTYGMHPSTHKYPNHVFVLLIRVERVQRLYFEIYHLVRMLHEVIPKYKYEPEFKVLSTSKSTITDFLSAGKVITEQQKRVSERKKEAIKAAKEKLKTHILLANDPVAYQKMMDRMREAMGKYHREPNGRWPIEYGWEIDYLW